MGKVTARPVAYKWIERLQAPTNTLYRQCIAEFLGTFILILLIDSAISVGYLLGNQHTLVFAAFAGGVGLYLGFIIAGTVGVGHFNPAVTIPLATVGKTSCIRAPLYMLAQFLGAFLASCVVYVQYNPYFKNIHDEPAGNKVLQRLNVLVHILHSNPGPNTTLLSVFVDQTACVGLLMIALLALTDKCNTHNGKHQAPIGFIFVLAALIMAFGLQSCSINPAREIAGRVFATIIGLGDKSWTPLNNLFWLVSGVVAPILGGVLGTWIYYLLIEIHSIDEDLQKEETDAQTQTAEKDSSSA